MIYFMQPTAGGPVKIGFSVDVETRRRSLESYYRQPLAILATMPGGRPEEESLHQRFAHLRFGRTEQFRPAPELLDFIGKPLLAGANPDATEAMATTAPVRLDFDLSDHRVLRIVAAEHGKPMAVFARELVLETVRREYAELRGEE